MNPEPIQNKTTEGEMIRRFISLVALIVIFGGLIYLIPITDENMIGQLMPRALIVIGIGVALFVGIQIRQPAKLEQWITSKLKPPGSWPWIAVAIVLSVSAALATIWFETVNYVNYTSVLILWISAAGCYLAPFISESRLSTNWKQWIKNHRNELIGVALLMLLAAVLRFYKLGVIPKVLNGDEGWMGLTARDTVVHPYANPFALWTNVGAIYLQAMNFLFGLLGVSPFSLRLLSALGGTLGIPAIYLLGKQIVSRRVGMISAVLLAFSHAHINFSRTAAVMYTQSCWLVPFELYFLLSGIEKRSTWRSAAGGLLLGIHFCIYLTAQTIAAFTLIYTVIAILLFRTQIKAILKYMLIFWGGMGVMLFPHITFALRYPNDYISRLSMDGTFSGWLDSVVRETGQSPVLILGERVLHAFLSVFFYPARDFYGSTAALLPLITAALFLIGLGISFWKTRSLGYLLLNGYFWSVTFALGIFAIPASADTYRMLIVLPAAIIMAALGLDYILTMLGLGWEQRKVSYVSMVSALLVGIAAVNLWLYFFDFAGNCRYGDDLKGRFASYMGSYLQTLPREQKVYLLSDDVYQYGTHASTDFLSNRHPVVNVPESLDTLQAVSGEVVISSPNRFEELLSWIHFHPGGETYVEYDCTRKIILTYQLR